MSFSVGVQGTKGELRTKAEEAFANNYPSPAPRVKNLFQVALDVVDSFDATSDDEGNYSLSVSGHAQQFNDEGVAQDARDYVSISLNAAA